MDAIQLPAPGVEFGPDFSRRLGALCARRTSGQQRAEGMGRMAIGGAGSEFIGYRPYRPGEDLRLFDWNLYSRMRQSFVRVTRREANQSWAILLDSSASMGIGQPGKLQAAAEIVAGLSGLALGVGSRVQILCSSSGEQFSMAKLHQMNLCINFLGRRMAHGSLGMRSLLMHPGRFRAAGSVFVIGDLLDIEPAEALSLARRGRQIHLLQVLSPEELSPARTGSVIWRDPESPASVGVELSPELVSAYEGKLKQHLDRWKRAALRHRATHGVWPSSAPFEHVIQEVLGS